MNVKESVGIRLIPMDCGSTSCRFAETLTGMRNNGACRCADDLPLAWRRYVYELRFRYNRQRAVLGKIRKWMPTVAQLLDGWHCDAAWTEYDTAVRLELSDLQAEVDRIDMEGR